MNLIFIKKEDSLFCGLANGFAVELDATFSVQGREEEAA